MSNEVKSENADSQKVPAINTNITPEAFAVQRAKAKVAASQPEPKPKELEPQEVEAEVTDDMEGSEAEVETPVDTEVTEDEQSEEAESEDVHSKEIDLDDIESLSIEDLDALKKKLGGKGTLARFAELTSKRKQAEERLTAIEAKLNDNKPKEDPLAVKKEEKNPYADINTIEDLRDKAREVDDAIEWAEEVLDSNEDAGSDDSVAVIDNNDVTKGQVKKVLRDARKARKEHLPNQLQAIQAVETRKAQKEQMTASARKELPWLEGEDNDIKRQYEILVNQDVIKQAVKAVPDLEPYMDYMIAHAASSIYGRKEIKMDAKSKPAINAPSNPGSNAAGAERPEARSSKEIKAVQSKFKGSGSPIDFVALRTAQLSKQANLS